MNKLTDFILSYIACLLGVVAAKWVTNMFLDTNTEILTNPATYISALAITIVLFLLNTERC